MTSQQLRNKFDSILGALNSRPSVNFCTAVESAYEALTLAKVMQEYARILGGVTNLTHPVSANFLNQKPGRFQTSRAFEVTFKSGDVFYFATDIELFGITAMTSPVGVKFEADVVVIEQQHEQEITTRYRGYPAPQHLHSIYECKFGSYNKGQLRELLGLRRHVSYLRSGLPRRTPAGTNNLNRNIRNSDPAIALKMVRPAYRAFFDTQTQAFYDLEQIIVN